MDIHGIFPDNRFTFLGICWILKSKNKAAQRENMALSLLLTRWKGGHDPPTPPVALSSAADKHSVAQLISTQVLTPETSSVDLNAQLIPVHVFIIQRLGFHSH